MKNKRMLAACLAAAALVQLAVPGWLIVRQESVLRDGRRFKFRVEPVDPYDAFRGRYIALDLADDKVAVPDGKRFRYRQRVYASLALDGSGFAFVSSASANRPSGNAWVKAVISGQTKNNLRVSLPLRYYLEESRAHATEAALRNDEDELRETSLQVRVLGGRIAVEELFIGGRPVGEFDRAVREFAAELAKSPPGETDLGMPIFPGAVFAPEASARKSFGCRSRYYAFDFEGEGSSVISFYEQATGQKAVKSWRGEAYVIRPKYRGPVESLRIDTDDRYFVLKMKPAAP